jgi:hypothetical protein
MLQPLICQRQLNGGEASQQQQERQQQQPPGSEPNGGHLSGWELRLLMEYCDEVGAAVVCQEWPGLLTGTNVPLYVQ